MKRGGGVHTVPAESPARGWWNKVDGKIMSRHNNKDVAVEAGRMIAKSLGVEHTIHRSDGVISEKNSYGNDPHPPRDQS
jgi:hypothetical protein